MDSPNLDWLIYGALIERDVWISVLDIAQDRLQKAEKNVADWIDLHPEKDDRLQQAENNLADRIEEHPWLALHPKKEVRERLQQAEKNLAYRIEEHPKKQRPNANATAKGKVKKDALKNNK